MMFDALPEIKRFGLCLCLSFSMITAAYSLGPSDKFPGIDTFAGEWVVTKVAPDAEPGVEAYVGNAGDYLGMHLIVRKDDLTWLPKMKLPEIEAGSCRYPTLVQFVSSSHVPQKGVFNILCDGRRLLGPPAEIELQSKDLLKISWYDGDNLFLIRKK